MFGKLKGQDIVEFLNYDKFHKVIDFIYHILCHINFIKTLFIYFFIVLKYDDNQLLSMIDYFVYGIRQK